jgi:ketosteroid isomerase-like protein
VSDAETIVRRYFAIVADLGSREDELLELLHPDVRITEHPNAITPSGAVRDLDGTLTGYRAGKKLLSAQSFEIEELVAAGSRVAVQATWRGTIALGSDRLPAGTELVAHVAAWLTVSDGRVREHETFDCYDPLPGA